MNLGEQMKSEVKKDEGKLRYDLIPYASLDKMVEVLTKGNQKYPKPEQNWLVNSTRKDIARYEAAIGRHYSQLMQGEEFDAEMGTDHLANIAVNCMFIMALKDKFKRKDNGIV